MLKMNKRGKDVNWSKLANASPKPKRLHLEEDDCYGLFCPPDSVQIDTLNVDETDKCEASDQKIIPLKSRAIASFDTTNKIVKNFFSWLTGGGGDCKSDRQTQQITKRSSHLTLWTLVYVHRIFFSKLVDYQKVNGASESVLRGLASTEIYLKKVRKTVSKMMRLQWTNELDIDALEAKGH
ncbi:unnamed protein product [Porites lobata]|uniref:Uncharacterized protein n=1 Tax=Porites lobata TaxID=104759 RepID=A0ABN8PCQ7_9CNID|nr:unnamed protein product [Porites lobata]